mmetsp:Transcript_104358/g.270577  ORF Transcript_104358/g.270577 Transcript_104358/m.270577 type:complete len:267 (+) Transcript_104358:533-1333(+)
MASSAPSWALRFLVRLSSVSTRRSPLTLACNVLATAERAASVVDAIKTSKVIAPSSSRATAFSKQSLNFSSMPLVGESAVGQSSLSSFSSRALMWTAMTGTLVPHQFGFPHSEVWAKSRARLAERSLGAKSSSSICGKSGTAPSGVCGLTLSIGAKKRLEETVTTGWLAKLCWRSEQPKSSSTSPNFSECIIWNKYVCFTLPLKIASSPPAYPLIIRTPGCSRSLKACWETVLTFQWRRNVRPVNLASMWAETITTAKFPSPTCGL